MAHLHLPLTLTKYRYKSNEFSKIRLMLNNVPDSGITMFPRLIYCWLHVAHWSLLFVCYLLLVIHYFLLVAHYFLLVGQNCQLCSLCLDKLQFGVNINVVILIRIFIHCALSIKICNLLKIICSF